jgi:hypothetical protein
LNDQWIIHEIRKVIQTFIESNTNENTSLCLWATVKAVLKGKYIAMSTYIKNPVISNKYPNVPQVPRKPKTS